MNFAGSNREKRGKKIKMTIISGNAKLLLKSTIFNMKEESRLNDTLEYWLKGNIFQYI